MKKFSDLSREVNEDLEKKIQQIYDTYGEIDEGLIKRLNIRGLIQRAKQAGIRMKKLMRNPAHRAKIERKKKKQKSTPELMVKAQKQARNKIRDKFFPKYVANHKGSLLPVAKNCPNWGSLFQLVHDGARCIRL